MVSDHWSTRKNIRDLRRVFQVRELPVYLRGSFTVTNKSNSLTYTVASSFVCTSPLAATTVVGLLETLTDSNSAEFRSFLLSHVHWCSGIYNEFSFLRFCCGWCWETPNLGRWGKSSFCPFLGALGYLFGHSPRVSGGASLLSLSLFLRPILKVWSVRTAQWLTPSDGPVLSRMFAWRSVASDNCTRRIDPKTFVLFRKIDEDSGGSMSWNTQPTCRASFKIATALLSPSFFSVFCWVDLPPACAFKNTYPRICIPIFFANIHAGGCQKSQDGLVHLPLMQSLHGCRANFPDGLRPLRPFLLGAFISTILLCRWFRGRSGFSCRFCTLILIVPETTLISLSNTVLLLSIDSILLVLFQHHVDSCDS